jgi:hypothetical protein
MTSRRPPFLFWCFAAILAVALASVVAGLLTSGVSALPAVDGSVAPQQVASGALRSRARDATRPCLAVAGPDYHWTVGALGDDEYDEVRRLSYSAFLRAMGEPSLSCGAPPRGESYRFLWMPTFHRPIAVRVTLRPAGGVLVAIELDGKAGYSVGKVIRRTERILDEPTAITIRTRVVGSGFWGLPTQLSDVGGTDGARWVLEGQVDGVHHIVDRWSPTHTGFRALCLSLLAMSGVEANPLY